jgi:hypothetical protein
VGRAAAGGRVNAIARVRRARAVLTVGVVVAAVFGGVAAGGVVLSVGAIVGRNVGVSALAVGVVAAVAIGWWQRRVLSTANVALWVEEREPGLNYALVTAVETEGTVLEDAVARVGIERQAVRAALRASIAAVVLAALSMGLARRLVQEKVLSGVTATGTGHRETRAPVGGPITLTARVVPPRYTGDGATEVRDPVSVTALVGSVIELRGEGGLDSTSLSRVEGDGNKWVVRFVMDDRPRAVRLTRGGEHRVVALVPTPDEPPAVVLTVPRADTTVRNAPSAVDVVAVVTDDFGIDSAYVEYIVSAGEEEGSFTSHEGRTGAVAFGPRTRQAVVRATVTAALAPGSQLSVRVVARDWNDVSGPGRGSSETRTLRVAKASEYDSLAIEGAPPPVMDSAFLSQRMVVIETEALLKRRRRMARAAVVAESRGLGDAESQLRQRVDDILNGAPGGAGGGEPGEREDVDASRGGAGTGGSQSERSLYQTAYQAITDAAAALAVGEPDSALPHEYVALHALDSARVKNRLYLRGAPPRIVVHVDRVRLTGADQPAPAPLAAGVVGDSARRAESRRFTGIVALIGSASAGVVADSLTLLQVDVARGGGDGSALGAAAAALRAGGDARPALARARAVIEGPAVAAAGLR